MFIRKTQNPLASGPKPAYWPRNNHLGEPGLDQPLGILAGSLDTGGEARMRFASDSPLAYAAVPVALGLATAVAYPLHSIVPYSAEYIYLLFVAITAWAAGRWPGILTAILAPLTLDYFYLPPLYTFGFTSETWRLMFPFLLFALGAAWLSSIQAKAKKAQSALLQNEERFTRIFTSLPDIVWTMRKDGRLTYVSSNTEEVTGFAVSDLLAGDVNTLFAQIHPDDLESCREAVKNLFSSGTPFDIEFRFKRKDGKWIWLHNRATGIYPLGSSVCADGVISDISRRKAAEFELKSKTALLEAQMNSTIDGILVVDEANRRVLQNRRLEEIFQIPQELLVNDDDQPVRSHVTALMRDPRTFQARVDHLNRHPMETSRDELETKDGRFFDRYSSPVVDASGKYYGRIWTFRDITQRRKNEDALRQLSLAVEQSPNVVVITDPNGNITYVNRQFTECTGYTCEEVLGKNPRILNSGYSSPETYRELWRTITHGGSWRGEFRNKKKDGELYWEAATITPIFNSIGEISNFLAMKEDITLRKLAEEKLAQAKIEADEADRRLRAKHLALESERQILDALINNVPDFMYVKDPLSRFVVANAHTARALGVKSPNDLVGKTDFDFLPQEMARTYYKDEQELLRSGIPLYNREEAALDENQNQIQVLTTKVPIRDSEGKITGLAGVGRNITARKQMEDALREAEQRFHGIFDNAIIGIFQSTPAGCFLSVNPSMAAMFGYSSPEEMVALVSDVAHQLYSDPRRREKMKARIIEQGGVQNLEGEATRKDGTPIWISMSVRGIFEDGVIVRYEGMCADVTEQRLLRDQLLQAQKLESVGQLAAGIAHEINTPTQFVTDNLVFLRSAWSTSADLLEKYRGCFRNSAGALNAEAVASLEGEEKEADLDFISTEVPHAIDQALDGVHRVAQIVKAMREFSHPDSAEKVQVDLNRAIESTITIARNEWKYVAEIATDFDTELPLVVCYPGEVNQVVLNLLVNAAHAIKDKIKDGEHGKIAISTRSRGQYAEIAIRDTGTGIPLSIQSRIFEPFFTTKEVGKGTGQGLALAHSVIVKKHRGKLWFSSEVGNGTTFFIHLPVEATGDGTEQ
jgi:PAS domain S-box-containing protein